MRISAYFFCIWTLLFSLPILAVVNPNSVSELASIVSARGEVPVIIKLNTQFILQNQLNSRQVTTQQRAISRTQSDVISRVVSVAGSAKNIKRFNDSIPFMAITVDAAGLTSLTQDPMVIAIEEDLIAKPTLASSIPVMDFDIALSNGANGAGQTLAIIDTGIRKSHSWFQSRVVSEACFSTNNAQAESLCPGGVSVSTMPGSGIDCDPTIAGCGHGTHVAGIAAGKNNVVNGAANGSTIIAIKVFSKFTTECSGVGLDSPCALTYSSDYIAALTHVNSLRNSYNIAAVNMSLGGGGATPGVCDGISTQAIIATLRSNNIATVISAGNSRARDAMSFPACVSSAISVCSTEDNNDFSFFTNVSASTDVCAVGGNVTSAWNRTDIDTQTQSGTSMSAPFVTGLFAIMKQAGCTSVDQIEAAIKSTGILLADNRSGGIHTKPRIDADAAIAACEELQPPSNDSLCFPSKTTAGKVVMICGLL